MRAYSFQRIAVGSFNVYKSAQVQHDVHLKKFAKGVTPQNQQTLNVYLSGEFHFGGGGFSQVLRAGDTSTELAIAEFPAGIVFNEKVLSPEGLRYCISPAAKSSWNRARVSVSDEVVFEEESVLVVVDGQVDSQLVGGLVLARPGQHIVGNGKVIRCWIPPNS